MLQQGQGQVQRPHNRPSKWVGNVVCPVACVTGVKGGGEGLEGKKKKKEEKEEGKRLLQKPRLFAFRPLFQLSQQSLKRPIRIRRALFCMTDFTRECIAKGGFVAVEHEKVEKTDCQQQPVGGATPLKICKRGWKPNVNVTKK